MPNPINLSIKELLKEITEAFIKDGWITLYARDIFAIIANDSLYSKEQTNTSWVFNADQAHPTFKYDTGGIDVDGYYNLPNDDAALLVYTQFETGYYHHTIHLSDEFIRFYDLRKLLRLDGSWEYIAIDSNGDETIVAKTEQDKIKVLQEYVLEFSAVKKQNIIIQFDFIKHYQRSLDEMHLSTENIQLIKHQNLIFSYSRLDRDDQKACEWIRGKYFIKHNSTNIKRLWDKQDNRKETFIVGKNPDGSVKLSTCDVSQLPSLESWEGQSIWQMTPVVFKKEVLKKYYQDSGRFEVQDGAISGPEWFAHLDSDRNDEYVIMLLKDLGGLPYKEQLHWRKYNIIPPDSIKISSTSQKRWIEGKACNPQYAPDLIFKKNYEYLNKQWSSHFGWQLFRPLAPEDQYLYKQLHMMYSHSNGEFDALVGSITKIVIDSLNEAELLKGIDENSPAVKEHFSKINKKGSNKQGKESLTTGISKFITFLISKKIDYPEIEKPLRMLQKLRSTTVAHRKTTSPKSEDHTIASYWGINKHPQKDVIEMMFNKFSEIFENLARMVSK